jgi:hypothetical protein
VARLKAADILLAEARNIRKLLLCMAARGARAAGQLPIPPERKKPTGQDPKGARM